MPHRFKALQEDPRVKQARELMLEALADHQEALSGVAAADPELTEAYQQLLEEYGENRGGSLVFPYLGSGLGRGPLVELADGSVKYDCISGIGVHYLGHGHPKLAEATLRAALEDTVMQGNLQQNQGCKELQDVILKSARRGGAALDHVFFTTSGAMANENALKILLQKKDPAHRILAFENCFMGRTLALSGITDKPAYRRGLPQLMQVDYVPFYDPNHPGQSTDRALDVLRGHLQKHPGEYACMCFELVQGEGGFYPGDGSFFKTLMDELRRYQVSILVDEIQTFGRTEALFAFQYFGLEAYVDVLTIGKLSQVCATLYRKSLQPKPGLVSQTFTGATASLYAAIEVFKELEGGGYFGPHGKIRRLREVFIRRFEALEKKFSFFRGPYGTGMMLAFTLFDGNPERTKKFLHRLYHNGVIAFVAGADPMRLRFLPPAPAMEESQVNEVCDILEKTLAEEAG